ncbi:DDIAS protein, partial [Upupa epops]|nr:DDIAS protein [Upupa epops]
MNSVRELLAASVISIQNSCFFYPACQKCFSRLILDSQRAQNCPQCSMGGLPSAQYRGRIRSLLLLATLVLIRARIPLAFLLLCGFYSRCIQDFNQLSGETNPDSSPEALVQAVEACFIGKRFLFGVKDRGREDGGHSAASSVFPNCSRIRSGTKKLTACQLFLPNAAVTGFTVIGYFHRLLQPAEFRSCKKSSDLTVASSGPADESVSELSSLSSLSTNSCLLHSGGRESCSGPWQQSLLLTSSVAWVTAEDFPTLELGKAVSEQHEQGGTPVCAESCSVSLNSGTLRDSELWSCSVQEGEREEGKGLSLQPSQPDGVSATAKLESKSSETECSRANSSRLLPLPLAVGVKSLCPEADSRNAFYPKKSHHSLFPKREASDPNPVNRTGVSQAGSVLWDELPLSESLNELLARLE